MEQPADKPAPPNAAVEAKKRIAQAYVAVLGNPDGALSEDQKAVWADIRHNAFLDATTLRADPSGRLDPERMLLGEGARTLALHFLHMIAFFYLPESEKAGERPPVLR